MNRALIDKMVKLIASKKQNPSDWLLAVRQIVEFAGANPAEVIDLNAATLALVCWATLSNMQHRVAAGAIEKALDTFAASC